MSNETRVVAMEIAQDRLISWCAKYLMHFGGTEEVCVRANWRAESGCGPKLAVFSSQRGKELSQSVRV